MMKRIVLVAALLAAAPVYAEPAGKPPAPTEVDLLRQQRDMQARAMLDMQLEAAKLRQRVDELQARLDAAKPPADKPSPAE